MILSSKMRFDKVIYFCFVFMKSVFIMVFKIISDYGFCGEERNE